MSVLKVNKLNKWFGGIHALNDISFSVESGQIIGLLGDNGAGKSTLLNIIAGNEPPTSGSITLDSKKFSSLAPQKLQENGVCVVYQGLALCDDLSVAENIFLGDEITSYGVMQRGTMCVKAQDILKQIGVVIDANVIVRSLSGGQRQAVAFARALRVKPKLLLLDEPTAAMGVKQTRATLKLIKQFKQNGTAIVLISHNLSDIMDVCDKVIILQHGQKLIETPTAETSVDEIIKIMML